MFSDSELNLILATPQYIKNVSSRKTDMKDAEWIAQLGCYRLIEPSYIPNPEVMQLRLLTRRFRSYKQCQTQIKNEIHNLLQRTNIKLSDIFTKTRQSLLMLFINGELIDYDNVTACIHKHVKANPEELMEAMNGKLSLEDRFLLDKSLEEYQLYQNLINKLTSEIIAYIEKEFPWRK